MEPSAAERQAAQYKLGATLAAREVRMNDSPNENNTIKYIFRSGPAKRKHRILDSYKESESRVDRRGKRLAASRVPALLASCTRFL